MILTAMGMYLNIIHGATFELGITFIGDILLCLFIRHYSD